MIYTVHAPCALIIIPGIRTISHMHTHNPWATLCVSVHCRITQLCGTALIVIPSSVSLCAFVLTLSTVRLRLLLATAVSIHGHGTASLHPSEMNAGHQTWSRKSLLLNWGQPLFEFTQFKATQAQKFSIEPLELKMIYWCGREIISYKLLNDNLMCKVNCSKGREIKVAPVSFFPQMIKMDSNSGAFIAYAQGQTAVHIWDLSVCVDALLPSGLFWAVEKNVEPTSHHIMLHCITHTSSLNHSQRQGRNRF